MRRLIVPDVHEEFDRLMSILDRYAEDADEVVFLGDFLDSYNGITEATEKTIEWIGDNAANPKYIFLMGNHDAQYAFPAVRGLRCSGYNPMRDALVDKIRPALRRFKLFHQDDDTIFSHAGFHPSFMRSGEIPKGLAQEALSSLGNEVVPPIMQAGWLRGGPQKYGGVTWLDWDEFVYVDGVRQIVGHTKGSDVRTKGRNVCLDTGLRHVGILDGHGLVEVVDVA